MAGNTGNALLDTKASRLEGTREGLDKFWNMITLYKNILPAMK
jgi:hypothetical protein